MSSESYSNDIEKQVGGGANGKLHDLVSSWLSDTLWQKDDVNKFSVESLQLPSKVGMSFSCQRLVLVHRRSEGSGSASWHLKFSTDWIGSLVLSKSHLTRRRQRRQGACFIADEFTSCDNFQNEHVSYVSDESDRFLALFASSSDNVIVPSELDDALDSKFIPFRLFRSMLKPQLGKSKPSTEPWSGRLQTVVFNAENGWFCRSASSTNPVIWLKHHLSCCGYSASNSSATSWSESCYRVNYFESMPSNVK
jgi:hypothetical protein